MARVAILRALMRRKLSENWKRVEKRIADACHRAGRKPESVKLIAVTKYASLDLIRVMVDLGFPDLAESRVQFLLWDPGGGKTGTGQSGSLGLEYRILSRDSWKI